MGDFRVWALLSALLAGITAVLAKKGVQDVPSNLAMAIRVVFVLIFAIAIALFTKQTKLEMITQKAWVYLFLSAIATGASWLCYFRALQLGPVSQVAPIDKLSFVVAVVLGFLVLGEAVTAKVVVGSIVIVAGVLITLS